MAPWITNAGTCLNAVSLSAGRSNQYTKKFKALVSVWEVANWPHGSVTQVVLFVRQGGDIVPLSISKDHKGGQWNSNECFLTFPLDKNGLIIHPECAAKIY